MWWNLLPLMVRRVNEGLPELAAAVHEAVFAKPPPRIFVPFTARSA
jgi:hypothetical protein